MMTTAMMTTADEAAQTAKSLQRELDAIAAEIAELKNDGPCLQNWRFALVAPGGTAGTASQKKAKYGRLTTGRGPTQRSRYVALADIAATQDAVTRGQALTKLEKAQARTMAKLEKATARARV